MSTTIELLSRQHQEVLERLPDTAGGTPLTTVQIAEMIGYLRGEVLEHFELEERGLFPVLGRYIGHGHGPLAVMEHEHAAFRQLLDELSAAHAAGRLEAQRECAGALVALLQEHIAKEDHVLFPLALRMLTPEDIGEVDAAMAA